MYEVVVLLVTVVLATTNESFDGEEKAAMEASKNLAVFLLLFALISPRATSNDASIQHRHDSDSTEQLKAKIAHLESEKNQQLRSKDEIITQQSEHISILRKEKDAMEARASHDESNIRDLISKLDSLQKTSDEQKIQIRVAEEEMFKVKSEVTSLTKDLVLVHGAWLPPWLAARLIRCQTIVENHWIEHGKSAMDIAIQKTLQKKSEAGKWAEPHLETIKTTWIPAIKEQLIVMTLHVEPHVQSMSTKFIEIYETSKEAINPHIIKVGEFAGPHFEEVKKLSKPYINQVAIVTEPHINKVRGALNPYSKKVVHAYERLLEDATAYHFQAQATVHNNLKKHELTRALATKELEWFLASVILALPGIVMIIILFVILCKKAKKPIRTANTHHARLKAKRGHSDK